MINAILIGVFAYAAGPFKLNGANIPAKDLVTSGQVAFRAALASVNGGRVLLSTAKQQEIDKVLTRSGTVMIAMVDNSWTDTTAFSLGPMKLVRKLDTWYLVNTTDNQWRQINLGVVPKGGTLNLALVEDGSNAHVYFNGKDFGMTPYAGGAQTVVVGSPRGETTPWQGELRHFEVVSRQMTAEDLSTRYAMFQPMSPNPTTPTPTSPAPAQAADTKVTTPAPADPHPAPTAPSPTTPSPTIPAPSQPSNPAPSTPPANSNPAPDVAATKSVVVVADVTAISAVPDPKSILPYRHALVTEELKVVEVKSGHISKVDVGKNIRVARWGVVGGQKTDVSNVKVGDRVMLTLELFADHPDLANYYTIDTIPEDYEAQYLLDVERKAPSTNGL